jgi:hypothetical protein
MSILTRKSQTGIIGAVFLFIFFLIIWFIWLGGWVATTGHNVVVENNLSGVEGFFYDNLNLIILICLFLGIMGFMYFGMGAR